jgi:hypothetical protein
MKRSPFRYVADLPITRELIELHSGFSDVSYSALDGVKATLASDQT